MKKLLVTGASGFLGWNLSNIDQNDWNIIGTWYKNQKGIQRGIENLQVDLTNKDEVWATIKEVKPDGIFHLAADSRTNFCEQNPEITYQSNVLATQYLTEFAFEKKIPFLFTSSGQVFDGLAEEYHEVNIPNPKNIYGKQKLEAEQFIVRNYPKSLICRVPVMFGKPSPTSQNFANNWIESWKKGEAINAFYDEYRSFLSGIKAAEGLLFLLKKGAEGIFHIGGEEGMNRVTFAKNMASILNFPNAKIVEKSQKDIQMAAYRPPSVIFKSLKIKELGFELGQLESNLRESFS